MYIFLNKCQRYNTSDAFSGNSGSYHDNFLDVLCRIIENCQELWKLDLSKDRWTLKVYGCMIVWFSCHTKLGGGGGGGEGGGVEKETERERRREKREVDRQTEILVNVLNSWVYYLGEQLYDLFFFCLPSQWGGQLLKEPSPSKTGSPLSLKRRPKWKRRPSFGRARLFWEANRRS